MFVLTCTIHVPVQLRLVPAMESPVDVGYVEETDAWRLESRFFPSKVGGRPAWLNLSELPPQSELLCKNCQRPCVFLCQVYSPIETRDDCFHRTLFVFMCREAGCCIPNSNINFIVLRCQLQRLNKFFPSDPPEDSETWHPEASAEKWTSLCAVCGCHGTSHCGRCKKVKYCGRDHQVLQWKEGHRDRCNTDNAPEPGSRPSSFLLPELELVTEAEGDISSNKDEGEDGANSDDSDDEDAEKQRVEEFERLKQENKTGTLAEDENVDEDLLKMAACETDKTFLEFKRRIAHNPDQVLRYDKAGVPLWMSNQHLPSEKDIPPCSECGSERTFEFQILPQLLSHLSLDSVDQSVDWGILAVYTCKNSCNGGQAYKKEFLWKQDITA